MRHCNTVTYRPQKGRNPISEDLNFKHSPGKDFPGNPPPPSYICLEAPSLEFCVRPS